MSDPIRICNICGATIGPEWHSHYPSAEEQLTSLVTALRALPRHVVQIGGSELQDGGLVQHCAVIVYASDLEALLTGITGAET